MLKELKQELRGWTLVGLLLVSLAGVNNAAMDKLQFHYGKSWFKKLDKTGADKISFWGNPRTETWKRKYKNNDPKQGAAFPLSTSALVAWTDAWHFFQMLMLACFMGAITLVQSKKWYIYFIAYGLFTGSFHLYFHYIF